MGKGFNNYMCKKFFHPASADNLKRVYQAQKKSDAEKKKQDDLRSQYDKEQELYNNKALLSKESKERLEVNFMYEPPPGVKKFQEEKDDENGEPEFKFEWQRTWGHAPRESHLQAGDKVVEQPFGIQVCEAKCIKCGKFGHMNTDKRCPLYGKAVDYDAPVQNIDQERLIQEMKAEGLAMRWSAWDMNKATNSANHQLVEEERQKPAVDRAELLKNMSKDEKKALLKKLEKMEKKKKKKKDKKEKKKKRHHSSDSDSETEERRPRDRRQKSRSRSRGDRDGRRQRSRSRDEKRRYKRESSEEDRRRRSRSRDRRERRRS